MSARSISIALFTAASLLTVLPAVAVPPSPEAKAKFIQEGTWEQKLANLRAQEAALPAGWYEEGKALHLEKYRAATALGADAVDTVRICVLLVEFSDFKHDDASYHIPGAGLQPCYTVGTPQRFDSLLFSEKGKDSVYNSTGSMTEFYMENSYGTYYIQGDVLGWFEVPNTYDYYVLSDDGLGRSSLLAHDAAEAADLAGVNFHPYGNGTSMVPGIIIIHAGPGAEQGAYGIWSNSGSMSYSADGVSMGRYAMQPEETVGTDALSSVGVFCHEWGHVLGSPDWYDVSYNSQGLGRWCLMAGGSWNGGGRRPAHFNGWTKYESLRFVNLQVLTANMRQAAIPQSETSPVAYMLKMNPAPNSPNPEFWIVENRQRVGFDDALPGSGLLIYHFDAMGNQTDPLRKRLAVEEADGRRDLYSAGGSSDATDPFPGGMGLNNRNFHNFTNPDSKTDDSLETQVSVLNISNSGPIMYADLNVYFAMPWLILAGDSLSIIDPAPGGNGDGVLDQGETLDIHLEVRNIMKLSYWPVLHLDVNNPGLEISQNDQTMGVTLNPVTVTNSNPTPIKVHIPSDFISSKVKFRFTVVSDSSLNTNDNYFSNSFEFTIRVGSREQILLVDDDNGDGAEYPYKSGLDSLGLLYATWDKKAQGSPVYQNLSQYPMVLWMTGPYYPGAFPPITGGILTADDVTFMKQLLDNGGNLLMGSATAPAQLQALDSAFMANYLHAQLTGSFSRRSFLGDTNNVVGGGLLYTTRNGVIWDEITPTIEPINGGQGVFTLTLQGGTRNFGHCGIIYDGNYRTAFLSFPVEFLENTQVSPGYAPMDSLINRALIFFVRGAATGVDDQPTDNLLPESFALDQNYPNPFNPSTTINYQIGPGRADHTSLAVFNVLGQRVATLVDETQGPGDYTVTWQGVDDRGGRVASGVYFYRLLHGIDASARKMVLLK